MPLSRGWPNPGPAVAFCRNSAISLWVDADVLAWLKGKRKGYSTTTNEVLRHFYEAHQ
jgi:uncharacterized protein (DUF4415 family)